MKVEVRYFSRGGNTKKIADAIADAAGVSAEPILTSFSEPVDLLFLGGGIYGGKPSAEIIDYVKALSNDKVKHIALFSTSMSPTSGFAAQVSGSIPKNITVLDKSFNSPGQFLFFKRKHPNLDDFNKAKTFALKTIDRFAE